MKSKRRSRARPSAHAIAKASVQILHGRLMSECTPGTRKARDFVNAIRGAEFVLQRLKAFL
jgi:hypothetical protein